MGLGWRRLTYHAWEPAPRLRMRTEVPSFYLGQPRGGPNFILSRKF
jgi:hypothetical protein